MRQIHKTPAAELYRTSRRSPPDKSPQPPETVVAFCCFVKQFLQSVIHIRATLAVELAGRALYATISVWQNNTFPRIPLHNPEAFTRR